MYGVQRYDQMDKQATDFKSLSLKIIEEVLDDQC